MSQMTYPQHMSSNRVVTIKKLEKVKKKKKRNMQWFEWKQFLVAFMKFL